MSCEYAIELFTGHGAQPYFARIVSAKNGDTLATSEGYSSKRKRAQTWSRIAKRLNCLVIDIRPETNV